MIDLQGIKNIIFDLGGVILDIDPKLTEDEFKKMGFRNIDEVYAKFKNADLFDQMELGRISPDDFRTELKKYLPENITDTEIDSAWDKLLLDFESERIKLLLNLKSKYRIFLLSNTNKIHFDYYNKQFCNLFGYESFRSIFERAYLSFEIHLLKPNVEIFNLVITENNLLPEETLFIDDTLKNIKGATDAGLKVYWLTGGEEITDIFPD